LSGLLPLHIATGRKFLTAFQKRILAVNLARANGVPADFTRIPNVISVMLEGEWQYYDIQKGKLWSGGQEGESKDFDLYVNIMDENGFPLEIDASHWS
jgi:hypothetical protein